LQIGLGIGLRESGGDTGRTDGDQAREDGQGQAGDVGLGPPRCPASRAAAPRRRRPVSEPEPPAASPA
ncbi:hypothetical protein ACFXKP_37135, partial [Streptomyces anulatus]